MNKVNPTQLTLIPTGINDEKINNIEMSIPFHCILYAKNKSFYISLNGELNIIDSNHFIFIKKSTPFTVLLEWGDDIDVFNDCLFLVQIPQDAVIEYCKKKCNKIQKIFFKSKARFDYISIYHSSANNCDVKLLKNIIESFKYSSDNGFIYTKVDEVKYVLMLTLIEDINPGIESMLLSNISLSTSDKVANLVVNNYSRNWTSKELSFILNMSESTFKKKMYNEIGSINNFITEIKMIEALRLLRHTRQPVNMIAILLGYNSPSYFTNVFKKHFGIYPSTLKKL